MLAGNDPDFIAAHTAHDMAGMVRSYTKWDAEPMRALVAIQRAYNEAIRAANGTDAGGAGVGDQKRQRPECENPGLQAASVVTIDDTRAKEIAKGLVEAQNPRIAVGRLRTPEGVKLSVELVEMVGASTSTSATGGPMSFSRSGIRFADPARTPLATIPWVWKQREHRLPSPGRRWRKRRRCEIR